MARIGKVRAPVWLPLALAGDAEMKNTVNRKPPFLSAWTVILPDLRCMVFTGLVMLVSLAGASGSLAKAADPRPDPVNAYDLNLTILADQEAYPQSYQLDGHVRGVLYDLLQDFSKRQQIDMTFRYLPLKRALEDSQNNPVGFIGISGNTASTPAILSDAISTTSLHAITLDHRNLAIRRPADLDGLQVSMARGLQLHDQLARFHDEGRFDVTYVNSIRQSIALLLAGRVDAVLIYCGYAQKASLKQIAGLTDDEIAALSIHRTPLMKTLNRLALPTSPANARLMHRFNSYLAKQRSSGALATLYAQYLVDENTIEMVLGDTLTSSGTGISNSK